MRRPTHASHGTRSASTLTAVCVAGSLRTFMQRAVQLGFVRHLHHEGYEYFVVTNEPMPTTFRQHLLVAPIRSWLSNGTVSELMAGRPNTPERDQVPRGTCPAGTCNPHRFLHPFVVRFSECFYAMQAEEGARQIEYATVLRVRPDHLFLRRLPPVLPTGWMGSSLAPGHVLLWDDQFSVALREDAASVYLSPSVVYSTCADRTQWARAAAAGTNGPPATALGDWTIEQCRDTGLLPCPVMGLLVVFGAAKRWREIQITARGWQAPGVLMHAAREDFCLKRRHFINDTAAGRWKMRHHFDTTGLQCR